MSNIISTKVKFVRNLQDVKFETNIDNSNKSQVLKLCLEATNACDLKGMPLNDMSESVINNLLTREMIEPEFVYNCNSQGFANLDNVAIQINGKNHIEIFAKNTDIFTSYEKAKEIDKKLCNKLHFAYSDKYGFLTPDIKNLGSGMSVEIKLILPALAQIGALNKLPTINEKLNFDLTCLDRQSGLCVISTIATLGYTERQICELTKDYIDKIEKLEIETSKKLTKDIDEVTDKLQRAKAILTSCIKIGSAEAYVLLGNILIAINAGVEKEINYNKINEALNCIKLYENDFKNLAVNLQKILK